MRDSKAHPQEATLPEQPGGLGNSELEVHGLASVALSRLIEEVRNEGNDDLPSPTAYNRTYHRHNR